MRMRLRTPLAVDALVAAAFTAITTFELVLAADRVEGPFALQIAAFWLMTGAIALRRTAPLAASLTCALGLAAQTLVGDAPVAGGFLALLLVTGSLGWHATTRSGLLGLAATLAAALLYDVIGDELSIGDLVVNAVIVIAAWGSMHLLRRATDRRVAAELDADRAARDAVVRERDRIARDLHDSLAHALTLITIQAGGAREAGDAQVASDALAVVEDAGRAALEDMQRYLSLLGDEPTDAPGVDRLDELAGRVSSGRLKVDVDVAPCELPTSLSTTAYRIVQEALTNVVRHSDASNAEVRVRIDGRTLRVRVRDDGRPVKPRTRGSGTGLAGLTRRVALFGGTLAAGPDERGWTVEAALPVPPA